MNKPTRIKYKKTASGIYVSAQSFLGNEGTLLRCAVDPTTNEVTITAVDRGIVEIASCKSFSKAKIKAKEMLKNYGVTFYEEARNKKEVV